MTTGRGIYRGGTFLMNLILMGIGVAVLVRTADGRRRCVLGRVPDRRRAVDRRCPAALASSQNGRAADGTQAPRAPAHHRRRDDLRDRLRRGLELALLRARHRLAVGARTDAAGAARRWAPLRPRGGCLPGGRAHGRSARRIGGCRAARVRRPRGLHRGLGGGARFRGRDRALAALRAALRARSSRPAGGARRILRTSWSRSASRS